MSTDFIPAAGRAGSSLAVRAAFFLMVAADSFCISFLPVFGRALHQAGTPSWLSPDLAASLPVSIFWAMVAVAQISTGLWMRNRDHRLLLAGALGLCALGLAAAAGCGQAFWLIGWRGLAGLGYGAAMILVQDHLLRSHGPQARTRASGLYFAIFFAAQILGTLAGGALVGPLGPNATLAVAGGLGTTALALAPLFPRFAEPPPPERLRLTKILANRRLLGLIAFAAIPSRLINGAFVFYLVPLYLHDHGASQRAIAGVVMVYALVLATTTTFWSTLVDRSGRPVLFAALGVALSALAMAMIPLGLGGVWGTAAAVAMLGLSQAVGMSPQVTVLLRVAADEIERFGRTRLLGLFRVCERAGLFAGPLVGAWLIGGGGYVHALGMLTALMVAATLAFSLAMSERHHQQNESA